MYEMLTGKVPFDGENPVTVALKHINEEIVPPSELVEGIPPALERCVMKATSKYQTNRYANADELIEELNNISFVTNIATDSIFAPSDVIEKNKKRLANEDDDDNGKKKKKKKKKKGRTIAIIIAVILLLAAGGGYVAAWKMGIFSATKPAPDFLGKTMEEAEAIAAEEGFTIKQGKDIYSNDYPEGKICTQDPEPYMFPRAARKAWCLIS